VADPLPDNAVRNSVADAIGRVLRDSGRPVPENIADEDTFAAKLKLDSLDMAVLVVALETDLGVDPFRSGVAPVRTFGELVSVYLVACQQQGDS